MKNTDAQNLSALGAAKGGRARAASLSADERRVAASRAARVRWHGLGAVSGDGLMGDIDASFDKARDILATARREWKQSTASTPEDRTKLRQAAEKGWLAISTAADAASRCLPKGQQGTGPAGTPARTVEAIRILRRAGGAKAEEKAGAIRGTLHLACFYSDDPACTPAVVSAQFREVAEVIRLVQGGCDARMAKGRRTRSRA